MAALPASAGNRLRDVRRRLRLGQGAMAARLGISVSYLSQIETGHRPTTPAVLTALATAFPLDWSEVAADDETALLVAALEAARDPTIAEEPMGEDVLRRAARAQPPLARRLVALHAAYRRSQAQLAALDDAMSARQGEESRLPWEEVRDWFHLAGNYVDPLDRSAEALHRELSGEGAPIAAAVEARLRRRHGVGLDRVGSADCGGQPLSAFDPACGRLAIDRSLPPESVTFLLAHQLVRLETGPIIEEVVAAAELRTAESRRLLAMGLTNYAAGALVMPYVAFRQAAREVRHDIDRLRQRFGVSFEQACHRLSTLQRPGLPGIPFFFCRVDMAGNITKRHSATRLEFARFGGACPLWIVHEAVAIPDRILVQLGELPEGTRYVSMAKGLVKATGSYLRPARRYAVALGCEIGHAADFIYADQLDRRGEGVATPIGTSCRICPRTSCEQRAFPPAGRRIRVDPDRRLAVPYTFE